MLIPSPLELLRSNTFRCSSLFSVAAEWKPHMGVEEREEGEELFRSRLQLFSLAGGASRTDLRGSANTLMLRKLSITRARGTIIDFILMYRCGAALAAATCNPLPYFKGLTSRIVKLMCVCSVCEVTRESAASPWLVMPAQDLWR